VQTIQKAEIYFPVYTYEGRSPSVNLPFQPETYQAVEFDELITVVYSVLPDRLSLKS
jgi:hypothetical protein